MQIKTTVFTALFTALIAAGAYIIIPLGVVPVTLQTLFILLAGLLGGRAVGVSAAFFYVLLGTVGLPVFSGGTGGIGHLLGPTGGYIIGVIPAAFLAGCFTDYQREHRDASSLLPIVLGALVGTVIIYLFGVPWLKFLLGLSWSEALAAGVIPFLIGDILKLIAAVMVTKQFRPRIDEFLFSGTEG